MALERLIRHGSIRARVAFALAMGEKANTFSSNERVNVMAAAAIQECWRWVSGEPIRAETLYSLLEQLTLAETEVTTEKDEATLFAVQTSVFYAVWQAFRAELASGMDIEGGVPNDMAEGSEDVLLQLVELVQELSNASDGTDDLAEHLSQAFPPAHPEDLGAPISRQDVLTIQRKSDDRATHIA